MRYQDSKDYSAELLRLVLPLMSAHDAALNPVSYAVWYEYVSGINPELTKAVDALIDEKQLLGDDDVQKVFQRFIADRDEATTEKLQAELRRVMDEMMRQAQSTAKQAEQYGEELAEHTDALKSSGIDEATLSRVIDELINGAQGMRHSVTELQSTVAGHSEEVELLKEALQQAIGEAMTDPLTGLNNRRAFDRIISEVIDGGTTSVHSHSLLMLDVDHFKRVNDTHGHGVGDYVLQDVARIIRAHLRNIDILARYGGEEFTALLPGTGREEALMVAERIRRAVRGHRFAYSGVDPLAITISVGISVLARVDRAVDPDEAGRELLERADQALYLAKEGGRDRVVAEDSSQAS